MKEAETKVEVITTDSRYTYAITPEYKHSRRHTQIGVLNMLLNPSDKPDLLDIMGAVSKGARDFFILIKNNLSYKTNTAYLPPAELSKGQLNKRSQYYNELLRYGLVKRIPANQVKNEEGVGLQYPVGTYMVSPEYILPPQRYLLRIKNIWDQL